MPSQKIANTADQHGFVLIGTERLYLCHLPMFYMENHMYQLILEIKLPQQVVQQYVKDASQNPGTPYILENLKSDLFSLPEIKNGVRKSFQADLFRGLPDDPDKDQPFIHNVTTEICRIVYFRHFDYAFSYPQSLTYILFGNEKEAFLSHYLSKQPDYLHVLALTEKPAWLQDDMLEMGVQVNFKDLIHDTCPCENPVPAGTYKVNFQGQEEAFELQTGHTIWFSTQAPNQQDPCKPNPSIGKRQNAISHED